MPEVPWIILIMQASEWDNSFLKNFLFVFSFSLLLFCISPLFLNAQEAGNPVSQHILKRCEYLKQFRHIPVCSTCVASHKTIPAFYRNRDYRSAWTDRQTVARMFRAIEASKDDGLIEQDYHYQALVSLKKRIEASGKRDPVAEADFDMLLTDALLRLSYHLYYGKVNPESLDPDWNFKRDIHKINPAVYLQGVIESGRISESLEKLRPRYAYYSILRENLRKYRAMEAEPWPQIPGGRVLKTGMTGPRVTLLCQRLASEGYHPGKSGSFPAVFDEALEQAVKTFQQHHGLDADGIVGRNTLRELNVRVKQRIDSIRVNLERARWVLHDLDPQFLAVNIAAFELYYVRDGKRQWQSKVMVGKPYWKTPCFRATVEYVVVNPYWVVPPGILAKEVIPKIRRDPRYLTKENLEIVDNKGRIMDPESIRWWRINPKRFPYIIRQKPGPKNALGRIKFIFPNRHFVFLHDTPAKRLFSRSMRAFSHGCIRVEKPLELAEILFRGSKRWNREKIEELIGTGETRTIHLEHSMPILILYWTVTSRADGDVNFLQDIYGRDEKILIGLDTPLRIANIVFPWKQAALGTVQK